MGEDVKKSGKFWIENELVDTDLRVLSGNGFKVLIAITRHYNKAGTCYPSIRRLAKLTGLHHETVTKCLMELKLLGYFEQLVIRERAKLRYVFSKTARKRLLNDGNLLEKADTKEVNKEVWKEDQNICPTDELSNRHTLDAVRADLEAKGILKPKLENQIE